MFRTISTAMWAVVVSVCLGVTGVVGINNPVFSASTTEMPNAFGDNKNSTEPFSNIAKKNRQREGLPGISIFSTRVSESVGTAKVAIMLSAASTQTVEVLVHSVLFTATAGEDYYGFTHTVIFSPGETRRTVSVQILDDEVVETAESLVVRLAEPQNADILVSRALLTIVDDDSDSNQEVVAEVFDVEVSESTSTAFVEVRLRQPAESLLSIGFATGSSTATAGSDYYGVYQELIFQPGQTTSRAAVDILNDSLIEADELIATRIFSWSPNIEIARASGNIKIIDDDNDEFDLSPEQQHWLSEVFKLIDNGSRNWSGDPNELFAAADLSNCSKPINAPRQGAYDYGRAGQSYFRALTTAWYETRATAVLEELYRLSSLFWSNFKDHDNRGYPFIYYTRNDPRYCGDDTHAMDEILAHALLAHVAHIFAANRSVDPRYSTLANNTTAYLDNIWVPKWMNRMNPSANPEPVSGSNRGVTNAWLNRSRLDSDMTYFIRGLAHADMAGMEFFYTLGELTGNTRYTTHAEAHCRFYKTQGMDYIAVNDSYAWKHLPFIPYDPGGSPSNPFQETRDYAQLWMAFAPNMHRHGWCFTDQDMTRLGNTYFSGNSQHDVFERLNTSTMAEDVEGGNDSDNDDSERYTGQPGVSKFRMLSAAYLCGWDETDTIKDLTRDAATNNIVDQRYPDGRQTSPIMAAALLSCT